MIETPPNASEIGTQIVTKPWPDRRYIGIIVSAETAAAANGTKRKAPRRTKSNNPKSAKKAKNVKVQ